MIKVTTFHNQLKKLILTLEVNLGFQIMSKHYSFHIYLFDTADVEGTEGGHVKNNRDKSKSPDTNQPLKDAPED